MTSIKQAVILAGGQGLRMRPLTLDKPKPMIPIHGRPFVSYLLDLLKQNGIEEVVFLLGYLAGKVTEHFGDGSELGLKIRYSVSPVEDDAGTRVKKAGDLLADRFLLLYCDNYLPLDLKRLWAFHQARRPIATVTLYANNYGAARSDTLVDEDGFVTRHDKTRTAQGLNGVDAGFFLMEKEAVRLIPDHNFSLWDDFLSGLVTRRQLAGFRTDHRYYSIGHLDRLPQTEEFLRPKKVILLDRDGVINKKADKARYVTKWSDFEFLPGARETVARLTESGFQIFVITNQAGIARGALAESDLAEIHENMKRAFTDAGGVITKVYHCPHNWDEGCECRKPKPGMLFRAAHDHHFDLTKAVFVGDDERDKEAGDAAGCRTVLVDSAKGLADALPFLL